MALEKDKIYINDVEFPFTPIHDIELNDLDLDPFTNTAGYLNRNRIRHDVVSLNFSIEGLKGKELHDLLALRNAEWFNCTFWSDKDWAMVTKKMYCAIFKYHQEYIDPEDENNNIYTNINFTFTEQ